MARNKSLFPENAGLLLALAVIALCGWTLYLNAARQLETGYYSAAGYSLDDCTTDTDCELAAQRRCLRGEVLYCSSEVR